MVEKQDFFIFWVAMRGAVRRRGMTLGLIDRGEMGDKIRRSRDEHSYGFGQGIAMMVVGQSTLGYVIITPRVPVL